ncbi:MAG: PEGA domain-containing protein [Methanoregulaceae archaeon]|nr:MAG: PEGA domain-containing protein [Methanoregulaceae archaeon]
MRVIPALLLLCLLLATIVPVSAISPGIIKTIGPVQTQTTRLIFSPVITPTETNEMEAMIGTLIIESDPPGAEITIFVAGTQMFPNQTLVTPYYTQAVGFGTTYPYAVNLKMPGYSVYSEQVAVQPKQIYTIHAVLIPLATMPTQPQFTQPAQAGTMTAPVPDTTAQSSVTASASPSTSSGGQTPASPAPGTGSLSVATTPSGAAIEIDSIPAGASPATVPGLAAGTHNLTITMPGYAALITQVNIVGGQTMEYSTTLIPATDPTRKQTPGFEAAVASIALACIVLLKRTP